MVAKVISGREVAETILTTDLKNKVIELNKKNIKPKLVVILVGDMKASASYVAQKEKFAIKAGIQSDVMRFESSVTESEILEKIDNINSDKNIHGVIVQLPLPDHIDSRVIIDAIDPAKDADGFHAINVGRNSIGGDLLKKTFTPCTPLGCYLMLKQHISDLKGMHAVIIGRSNIVGKPMAQLLLEESCTVSIVHSKTKNIEEMTRQGDIVVAAVGRPLMVKKDWIKPGAVVIDVGINRIDDAETGKTKLVGDVDYEGVSEVASAITPVPGGVGPMTIACLLKNTVDAANRQAE